MENEKVNCESDKLLLLQMEQGNKAAFNKLYNKYWDWAYSRAFARLGNSSQTEDVVQNVFVKIWLRRENPISNFQAYLHVAIRNQVFKVIAKEKKKCPFIDNIQNFQEAGLLADRGILWEEFHKEYQSHVEQLPPKRQKIFRLRFHEDLTTKEISSALGVSRKTVQNQLGKAISQLRVSFSHLFSFIGLIGLW
ncbi:sigma-70 family RNA polymerase sigma factor [Flagellimonas olearia]|uniref:Sigma-70 family RNA polymerase sigma factor n=1 Tax=Flagellimonas olearia TaxID=552546 RepID=A0A444VS90_9FLAO|nr:sigma-70 family RNA polymerase sigma factor [Allomuricauda olearia]KAB7530106.1 sigma-70 family RNA polymerase sigma factor [Allomuricauda olearia]RYC53500.1 hypothetical protein DN53_04660 [Allomuricauda olearia]